MTEAQLEGCFTALENLRNDTNGPHLSRGLLIFVLSRRHEAQQQNTMETQMSASIITCMLI